MNRKSFPNVGSGEEEDFNNNIDKKVENPLKESGAHSICLNVN